MTSLVSHMTCFMVIPHPQCSSIAQCKLQYNSIDSYTHSINDCSQTTKNLNHSVKQTISNCKLEHDNLNSSKQTIISYQTELTATLQSIQSTIKQHDLDNTILIVFKTLLTCINLRQTLLLVNLPQSSNSVILNTIFSIVLYKPFLNIIQNSIPWQTRLSMQLSNIPQINKILIVFNTQ